MWLWYQVTTSHSDSDMRLAVVGVVLTAAVVIMAEIVLVLVVPAVVMVVFEVRSHSACCCDRVKDSNILPLNCKAGGCPRMGRMLCWWWL